MTSCSELCTSSLDCDIAQTCTETGCVPSEPAIDRDGWDDEPGTGALFFALRFSVLNSAPPEDCWRYPGYCTALGRANVAAGSADRLHGLMEGPAQLLVEIAGLDARRSNIEEKVTVKLYDLAELGRACFVPIEDQVENAQAVTRLRATARQGAVVSTSTSSWIVNFGARLSLERIQVRIEGLERADSARVDVLGVLRASSLATLANPHCDGVNPLCPTCEGGRNTVCPTYPIESTVLEAIAQFEEVDADLDEPENGLEKARIGPDKLLRDCVLEDRSIVAGRDCARVLSDGFTSAHSFAASPSDTRLCLDME